MSTTSQTLMLPLHPTPSHPWSPLTDEEWHALEPYLRPTNKRTGRPPRNRRATWDAIFWVAVTNASWQAIPPEFQTTGGGAFSALAVTIRNGVLSRLLLAVSRHPFADPALAPLEYRIATAFRRAARQLPPEDLLIARNLGMATALPFDPALLPPPESPDAPPSPDKVRITPRIARRALRGLPPPRLPKSPSPGLAPRPVLLPIAQAQAAPRRARHQAGARRTVLNPHNLLKRLKGL